MFTNTKLRHSLNLALRIRERLTTTTIDTLLGGLCGALYGLFFGGLSVASHATETTVAGSVCYFGFCGALAVLILSAFCGVFDDTGELPAVMEIHGKQPELSFGQKPSSSSTRAVQFPPATQKSDRPWPITNRVGGSLSL